MMPKAPTFEGPGLFLPIEAPPEILKETFFKVLRSLRLNTTEKVFYIEIPPIEYSRDEIRQTLGLCANFSRIRPIEIIGYLPKGRVLNTLRGS